MNMPLGPIMMDLLGTQINALDAEQLQHEAVGGLILFTRNYESVSQLESLCAQARELRPGLLIAADTEGGRVQRFREGFIKHPAVAEYGLMYADDPATALQAAELGGYLLAAELLAAGVDLAFSPVVDIHAGLSAVIGDRAFSDQVESVCDLSAAHSKGLRAAGMAATAKHFPGHGFVRPDSHVELPVDERPFAELDANDLAPYRALIHQGLESVMVAHVRYPQISPDIASVSEYWIQRVLRQQLGFEGAVFSDDLSMGGLAEIGDAPSRVQAALDAGCDMLPVCNRADDLAAIFANWQRPIDPQASQRIERLRGQSEHASLANLHNNEEFQHRHAQWRGLRKKCSTTL